MWGCVCRNAQCATDYHWFEVRWQAGVGMLGISHLVDLVALCFDAWLVRADTHLGLCTAAQGSHPGACCTRD